MELSIEVEAWELVAPVLVWALVMVARALAPLKAKAAGGQQHHNWGG